MIIACPACSMRFQYDEARFAGVASKYFKCTNCGAVFDVPNPSYANTEKAKPPQPQSRPEPAPMGAQNKNGIRLSFLTGPKSSTAIELLKPRTIIGRDEGDVVTMDPETSKRHAMIEIMSNGSVWLEDLGSTNGTYTNGGPIRSRVQLVNRQEFSCGKSAFMLLLN